MEDGGNQTAESHDGEVPVVWVPDQQSILVCADQVEDDHTHHLNHEENTYKYLGGGGDEQEEGERGRGGEGEREERERIEERGERERERQKGGR